MGGAVPLALGLALSRPNHGVIVVTGDGALLMSLGSLVTVAASEASNANRRRALNGKLPFSMAKRGLLSVCLVMKRVHGFEISPNTIERICLEVGNDLLEAEQQQWQDVLTGEVSVPDLAIVEFDGGRIRTRQPSCGPGVHLSGKGWNETKNAIFVNATSDTSNVDPEPEPPPCFLDPDHVAKLSEKAKTKEKQGANDDFPDDDESDSQEETPKHKKRKNAPHKPRRGLLWRRSIRRLYHGGAFRCWRSVARPGGHRASIAGTEIRQPRGRACHCGRYEYQARTDATAIGPVGFSSIRQKPRVSWNDRLFQNASWASPRCSFHRSRWAVGRSRA